MMKMSVSEFFQPTITPGVVDLCRPLGQKIRSKPSFVTMASLSQTLRKILVAAIAPVQRCLALQIVDAVTR